MRRLVAFDMAAHGTRFIVLEFAFGIAGCAILGWLSLTAGVRQILLLVPFVVFILSVLQARARGRQASPIGPTG